MGQRGRPRHPEVLTPREQQVLSLIREGYTNEQIAAQLGIGFETAKTHVAQIIAKLGVETREEAAAWREREHERSFGRIILSIAGAGIVAGAVTGLALLAWGLSEAGDGEDSGATGITEVDAVISAVESGDSGKVLSLIKFDTVACSHPPRPLGGPPECRTGETTGDLVEVLELADCEGGFVRPDGIANTMDYLTTFDHDLYAVFAAPATWEKGDYAAVFSAESPQGSLTGQQVLIEEDGIVSIDFGCGQTPAVLVEDIDDEQFLIRPRE